MLDLFVAERTVLFHLCSGEIRVCCNIRFLGSKWAPKSKPENVRLTYFNPFKVCEISTYIYLRYVQVRFHVEYSNL